MKSFKEFQTESYSRLDENTKLATDILSRGARAWIGKDAYDAVVPDVRGAMPTHKDGKKIKSTKGNWKGQTASAIATGLGDQIVKKGWKYGVKPGWNRLAKPALTGAYNVGKWGVTTALPWALSQVFKPPGP